MFDYSSTYLWCNSCGVGLSADTIGLPDDAAALVELWGLSYEDTDKTPSRYFNMAHAAAALAIKKQIDKHVFCIVDFCYLEYGRWKRSKKAGDV
jgi:hypothetical protein